MNAHIVNGATDPLYIASHLLGALLFIAALTLVRAKRNVHRSTVPLQLLCFAGVLLTFTNSAYLLHIINETTLVSIEIIAFGLWLIATIQILSYPGNRKQMAPLKLGLFILWGLSLLGVLSEAVLPEKAIPDLLRPLPANTYLLSIILAIGVLSVLAFRTPLSGQRQSLRYFLYANLLMSVAYIALSLPLFGADAGTPQTAHSTLLSQTGLSLSPANTFNQSVILLVPLLCCIGAVYLKPRQTLSLSRKVALYAVTLAASSLFVLLLSFVSIYASRQSGALASLLQFAILLVACAGLGYVLLSSHLRNSIRVAIDKHLFSHKYDYRTVWLDLIQTLSRIDEDDDFFEEGLRAVGKTFDAQGGAIWLSNDEQFTLAANWNISSPLNNHVSIEDDFIVPFTREEWIYALNISGEKDHDRHAQRVPEWIQSIHNIWIIAPLMLSDKLLGFFILTRETNNDSLIWEDIDVIKSTSRQLAGYIARQQSAEQLARSRQFDTYNKLTAFIMHDLKNLIAQQALVVENAKKYKENPAFVEDAIRTIDNSVTRMNQLLKRLQRNSHQSVQRTVSVKEIITEAIRKSADRQPIPTLRSDSSNTFITADREQIIMILLHIIRNAQDATSNDGFIDIEVNTKEDSITIDVEDNGCGMDEDFINNRLFKPFDSTKSSMGMGIGAYQVREFIESMGGKIKINSQVNVGTTVCIRLPATYSETVRAASQ